MTKIAGFQCVEYLGNVSRSVSVIVEGSRTAQNEGASLVCFPECYLQGYIVDPEHTRQLAISLDSYQFAMILKQFENLDIAVVFGLIEEKGQSLFNTAVVVRRGILIGAYRKVNLLAGELRVFSPGTEFPVFNIDGVKFGISICYDLNFPECVSNVARAGAQLIVCPCNNMHRLKTAIELKEKHNEIRALRCRESKIWLLSSDVTGERDGRVSYGPTSVIDSSGNVIAQAKLNVPGSVICEIAA